MDAPSITLGGITTTLRKPSAMLRFALATRAGGESESNVALGAVILRNCWPEDVAWPVPLRPREWTPTRNIVEYGCEIYDGLGDGLPLADITTACGEAYQYAARYGLPRKAEVDEAEDFSEANKGA